MVALETQVLQDLQELQETRVLRDLRELELTWELQDLQELEYLEIQDQQVPVEMVEVVGQVELYQFPLLLVVEVVILAVVLVVPVEDLLLDH